MAIDDRFYSMRGRNNRVRPVVPPEAGTLLSIAFSSMPAQTIYCEGDTIPLGDFTVMATYEHAIIDVSNGCTYTVNNPVRYGDSTLVVTYETLTLTWNYTVTGSPVHAPANTYLLAHFDGNLKDEVTGEYLRVMNPGPSYIQGMFSNAVDGRTSNVQTGTSRFPNLSYVLAGEEDPFTVTFWSNGTMSTQNYLAFGYGISDLSDNWHSQLGIRYYVTGISVTCYTTSTIRPSDTSASTGLTASDYGGAFHHHAIEVGAGLVRFYFDGVLRATITISQLQSQRPYQKNISFAVADEVMICKGNIYDGNSFTPPHGPYYL